MSYRDPISAGQTAPPLRPLPPELQPATRGDITAAINGLAEILQVLEDIRGLMKQQQQRPTA
jgi:hypothetical protein